MKKITDYTDVDLYFLAHERKEWAETARNNDMKGTAKEWELTIALIEEILQLRWQIGKITEKQIHTDEEPPIGGTI